MRILIIKLGAIGDVLRTTCVLSALKKYRDATIFWLTAPASQDILLYNLLIEKVVIMDANAEQNCRDLQIDLVINLDEDLTACKLATALGKKIIGFFYDEKTKNVQPTTTVREWYAMGALGKKPENDILKKKNTKTYQKILYEMLELPYLGQKPVLILSEHERKITAQFVAQHLQVGKPIIGINTGAGRRWKGKTWHEERTAELIDKLILQTPNVILFGGPEEVQRNANILKLCKQKPIDAGCLNPVRRFCALIDSCNVLVSSDSFAMHIGVALDKRMVVLFGPTSHHEIELYGKGKKIVPDHPCTVCYKQECTTPTPMDKITVAEVYAAVMEQMVFLS